MVSNHQEDVGERQFKPVAVIDDDGDVLEACCCFLDSAGWTSIPFNSADAYLRAAASGLTTSCVLSDVVMPGMSGIKLAERMSALHNSGPLILFSGQGTIAMAVEALRKGAVTFIEKPIDPEQLIFTIKDAISAREARVHEPSAAVDLSRRQRQVMRLVCAGLSNKEIARRLGISNRTVETYRANLIIKVRANSLADLIAYYNANKAAIDVD